MSTQVSQLKPLRVDDEIKKALKEGKNILVRGSRLCGKTCTKERLLSLLKNYHVVDLPSSSADEDYNLLKDSLKEEKIAIFIPNYYFDFYNEQYKQDEKKEITEVRDFTEIDHKIDENESKELFLYMISNVDLKNRLKTHPIVNLVLALSKHSDRTGYETYLPAILKDYAIKIERNKEMIDSIKKSKDKSASPILGDIEKNIDNHFEKIEKEIEEHSKHIEFLYNAFGIKFPWSSYILEALGGLLGVISDLMQIPFNLAPAGLAIFFGLYERFNNRNENSLSYLIRAKEHWEELTENEKKILAYDIERNNKLPPGTTYEVLSQIFEDHAMQDLGEKIEKYLKANPNLFDDIIKKSDVWKKIEDELLKQNTNIDKLSEEFASELQKIEKEIENIKKDIEKIKKEIEDINKKIRELEEQLYTKGAEKVENEAKLLEHLGAIHEETLVGFKNTQADENVKNIAQEVINKASNKLVFIIGEPGVGKSTLLYIIGKILLEQKKRLYYINNPVMFSMIDFPKLGEDAYAILDIKSRETVNAIMRQLTSLSGGYHLSKVIVAARPAHVEEYSNQLRNINDIDQFPLNLTNEILLEIAKRNLEFINSKFNIFNQQEIDSISQVLVNKSEGIALYISEATKKLADIIKHEGRFEPKMLEGLPQGIVAMILKILDDETERSPFLLITYYLVSHYPNFLTEFIYSLKQLFNIPEPRFVDKIADQQYVTLHSWYRDVTDWIFQSKYERLEFNSANVDIENFMSKVDEVRGAAIPINSLPYSYLQDIRNTLEKKPVLESFKNQVSEFMEYLGTGVPLIDLVDAIMLCLIFHVASRNLKKAGTEYGFLINRERVEYKSLDIKSVHFYPDFLGFLLNNYLNREISEEVEKGKRPFYALSILYLSRLLTGNITERIDDEFLGKSEPTIKLFDIRYEFINASQPMRLYLSAFSSVLEGIGYIKPSSPFERGLLFLCKGMFEEAIEEYDKAISLNPNDHLYHNNKGIALYSLGRYNEAIEEYDKAISLNPNYSLYHNNKGNALAELKRYEEAIKEYNIAIKLDFNNPMYHYNKGNAFFYLGRYNEAIEEYDKAISLNPNDHLYHNNKGIALYSLGRYNEALKSIKRVLDLNPRDLEALVAYILIVAMMGNPNEGIRKLRESIESGLVNKEELCMKVKDELSEEELDEKEKAILKEVLDIFCK